MLATWEREHGEPRTPEYLAWRAARNRHTNDLSCWELGVLQQRPEPTGEEGIYRYTLAYAHQTSGRAGAIGGGAQSCMRAMKGAFYKGTGAWNYDTVASQPTSLVELFEEANELAGGSLDRRPLDASWVEKYVANPMAKEEWAGRVGVEVDTWKTALIMLLMGATLPEDPGASRGEFVRVLRADPACRDPESFAESYDLARAALLPFYRELRRWHKWLDTEFVQRLGVNSPAGRVVKNAAGESYLWDLNRKTHERRAELAAHMLQGKERAFILTLLTLAPKYGFEPVADEHDGLVVLGEITNEAVEEAKRLSGVRRAVLVEKAFEGQGKPAGAPVETAATAAPREASDGRALTVPSVHHAPEARVEEQVAVAAPPEDEARGEAEDFWVVVRRMEERAARRILSEGATNLAKRSRDAAWRGERLVRGGKVNDHAEDLYYDDLGRIDAEIVETETPDQWATRSAVPLSRDWFAARAEDARRRDRKRERLRVERERLRQDGAALYGRKAAV